MIPTPPDFIEADYLALNPDVAEAVREGRIESGEHHYCHYGYYERRAMGRGPRPEPLPLPFPEGTAPSRRDKILANLQVQKIDGVEIGALASPIVKPCEGRIFFVDFADTETLRTSYAANPTVDHENIVDVGGVWGAKTLQECVGEDRLFDFVTASHVIEHTPDLVTWLAEIRSILKPDGTLRLAIPDRRYTFDYLRFESRIHDVLDAYLRRARIPLPHQIIDFCSLAREVDCAAAWEGTLEVDKLKPYNSTKFGFDLAKTSLETGVYFDTHCWVFTPASFVDLCLAMADLDLFKFACTALITTARNELEFFAHLAPSDSKDEIVKSWATVKTRLAEAMPAEVIVPE